VDPDQPPIERASVVPVDDDGALLAEPGNVRPVHDETSAASGVEAEVLVEVVVVEARDGGLQGVSRGRGAGRDAPPVVLVEQGGLGLGSGEAELAGELAAEPRGRVLPQLAQAVRHLLVRQPGHVPRPADHIVDGLGGGEPDRSGAVVTDRRR
jgi:hypothetical protein